MDNKTFELLKKIDEGFEEGSGAYEQHFGHGRGPALAALGEEGLNLRMDIMRAVEAEKSARKSTCRNPDHLVDCQCAVADFSAT